MHKEISPVHCFFPLFGCKWCREYTWRIQELPLGRLLSSETTIFFKCSHGVWWLFVELAKAIMIRQYNRKSGSIRAGIRAHKQRSGVQSLQFAFFLVPALHDSSKSENMTFPNLLYATVL